MLRAMALLLAGLLCVPAPRALAASGRVTVDVYMDSDNALFEWIYGAKAVVSGIYARIGIDLVWHSGLPRTTQAGLPSDVRPAFGIGWDEAPESMAASALAAAHPYGSTGVAITLYEDRLCEYLREHKDMEEIVLGYVLAHELAHVMQGIDRHSASGILKARWTSEDCDLMRAGKLTFTPEDVELIREGLKWRPASKAATLVG
ncbi:MAG TPA: hypothetical protein VME43_15485 [Bryobacteraceae bacterium]|nr:hypothetical protein [Bryobacteraceae bacterium]